MPAREKLNSAYIHGSLFFAVVAGWVSSSWTVFAVALVVLLAANLAAGEIRLSKRGR
jgi:hypothetical protein